METKFRQKQDENPTKILVHNITGTYVAFTDLDLVSECF